MDARTDDDRRRARRIVRQALSIAFAIAPFGVVFGVACVDAGLSWLEATGFSALTFTGSAQFAAVGVIGDGGSAAAAIGAGLLLNVRSLAFGILLAPVLDGPWWKRALFAQLVIDESTAVATAQDDARWRRFGFLAGGLAVFVLWNVTTLLGVALASVGDEFITDWGLDAAAPAAFLALLWPRLVGADARDGRRIAALGGAIAAVAIPVTPPGIPILAAGLGVLAASRPGTGQRRTDQTQPDP
jgi:predicted branched-subunit amino acid permease